MIAPDNNNDNDRIILTPVVICILVTETAERFAYFGFRAVLVLYFKEELLYSDTQAIALFAYTTCFAYLSPLAGALLADGNLGRYKTILYFGMCYVAGLAILTVAAAWSFNDNVGRKRMVSFLGLFLSCLGTGGIKPCVSAFGADQVGRTAPEVHLSRVDQIKEEEQEECDDCVDSTAILSPKQQRPGESSSEHSGSSNNRNHNDLIHLPEADPLDPRETTTILIANSTADDKNIHRADQVRRFFNLFYWCINVGAVTSIAAVPIVRARYGYHAAFLLPTLFMITALLLFVSKRHEYIHHVPGQDGASLQTTFRLTFWLLRHNVWSALPPGWAQRLSHWQPGPMPPCTTLPVQQRGLHALVPTSNDDDANGSEDLDTAIHSSHAVAGEIHKDEHDSILKSHSTSRTAKMKETSILHQQIDDAAQALHVLPIVAMFPIFWSLYDQQGSVWTLQAQRMELNGLHPEQLNVINPLEIMLFIPLFDRIIYPFLESRRWNIAPLRRMAWGMVLTAVAFTMSGIVESAIRHHEMRDDDESLLSQEKVNVFWQLPQITFLAIGEIFLSVTGLEFAYATSPDRLKAFLMAMFLLTTAVGDFFSGILYSTIFTHLNRAMVMHICALLMMANLGLFSWVARWYNRCDFRSLRRTPSLGDAIELTEREVI